MFTILQFVKTQSEMANGAGFCLPVSDGCSTSTTFSSSACSVVSPDFSLVDVTKIKNTQQTTNGRFNLHLNFVLVLKFFLEQIESAARLTEFCSERRSSASVDSRSYCCSITRVWSLHLEKHSKTESGRKTFQFLRGN